MDILVSIPSDQEEHIRATKLNPISGLTHGYWTLSGCPQFTKPGDRIWFCIFGEVIASARILNSEDYFEGGDPELLGKRAVCFDIPTTTGHLFCVPREFPWGFRGIRYVRRASKHTPVKWTQALEVVGAKKAKKLYPRNW